MKLMRTLQITVRIFLVILLAVFCVEIALRTAGDLYLRKLYVHKYGRVKGIPENLIVLCLGESTTGGLWVDRQHSYPAQLKTMLQGKYTSKEIDVIVPPHVGQNTSQVSNRIKHYIDLYQPHLIILMLGANNEWSLAESHIRQFIKFDTVDSLKVHLLIRLNALRVFKMARYVYLKYWLKEKSQHILELEQTHYIWGGAESTRYPPRKWVYGFAGSNQEAFVNLWRYDVEKIVSSAKKENIPVIIMTYHIQPTYLSSEEFVSLAQKFNISLVRNDLVFSKFTKDATIQEYLVADKDSFHPNEKGYAIIAQNVFKAIIEDHLLE